MNQSEREKKDVLLEPSAGELGGKTHLGWVLQLIGWEYGGKFDSFSFRTTFSLLSSE